MQRFWGSALRNVRYPIKIKLSSEGSYLPRLFCIQANKECDSKEKFENFNHVISRRREEANKSVVVQVSSEKSFTELYNYCCQFGGVIGAHHYKIPHDELHYILVEFEDEAAANSAIDCSCFNEDFSGIPVRSPFLWFKAQSGKKNPQIKKAPPENVLVVADGNRNITDAELEDLLHSAETLEDQILILHRNTCLNDLGTRLRFLAARQVENSISGMFPQANAQPFGSSVNGFGRMGCDLDLILRFDHEVGKRNANSNSRLVFHTKENLSNGRSQTQRQMESIGDILHLFLPGVCHVRRILQARVPIIKFHHEHLNVEVDLSMSNLTGVYMSELFYMFGQIDHRVKPLVFCLRKWAQSVGLTNPSPGRWITNFSLTCLVIFFLQQLKNPILPSINFLCKAASSKDIRITEDGVNCTFLRDCNSLRFPIKNKSSLSDLLLQFFEFYSQFDFSSRAVSLNEGRSIVKPDHSAVYIVNPLEQVLNVTKNISLEECERFRIEVRNAAWILESEMDNNNKRPSSSKRGAKESPWGLQNLLKTSDKAVIRPNLFFKPRMVEVSELFDEADAEASQKIQFKNNTVKKQVQGIRTKAKDEINKIRMNALPAGGGNKGRR